MSVGLITLVLQTVCSEDFRKNSDSRISLDFNTLNFLSNY